MVNYKEIVQLPTFRGGVRPELVLPIQDDGVANGQSAEKMRLSALAEWLGLLPPDGAITNIVDIQPDAENPGNYIVEYRDGSTITIETSQSGKWLPNTTTNEGSTGVVDEAKISISGRAGLVMSSYGNLSIYGVSNLKMANSSQIDMDDSSSMTMKDGNIHLGTENANNDRTSIDISDRALIAMEGGRIETIGNSQIQMQNDTTIALHGNQAHIKVEAVDSDGSNERSLLLMKNSIVSYMKEFTGYYSDLPEMPGAVTYMVWLAQDNKKGYVETIVACPLNPKAFIMSIYRDDTTENFRSENGWFALAIGDFNDYSKKPRVYEINRDSDASLNYYLGYVQGVALSDLTSIDSIADPVPPSVGSYVLDYANQRVGVILAIHSEPDNSAAMIATISIRDSSGGGGTPAAITGHIQYPAQGPNVPAGGAIYQASNSAISNTPGALTTNASPGQNLDAGVLYLDKDGRLGVVTVGGSDKTIQTLAIPASNTTTLVPGKTLGRIHIGQSGTNTDSDYYIPSATTIGGTNGWVIDCADSTFKAIGKEVLIVDANTSSPSPQVIILNNIPADTYQFLYFFNNPTVSQPLNYMQVYLRGTSGNANASASFGSNDNLRLLLQGNTFRYMQQSNGGAGTWTN